MVSRVLQENDVVSDVICRGCQNAIWRVSSSLPDKCPTLHTQERRGFACWCAISHEYVPTAFEDCDAYIPGEESEAEAY